MFEAANIREWRGHDVMDAEGHKIGELEAVYVDTVTDLPSFGTVEVGLPTRHRLVFVPLEQATVGPGHLKVGYARKLVRDVRRSARTASCRPVTRKRSSLTTASRTRRAATASGCWPAGDQAKNAEDQNRVLMPEHQQLRVVRPVTAATTAAAPKDHRMSSQEVLSGTWPANHHHAGPAAVTPGQSRDRVFGRHRTGPGGPDSGFPGQPGRVRGGWPAVNREWVFCASAAADG
jgi:hypothetical protein